MQDHVIEFEEGQRLFAVEPALDAVKGQHPINGEMRAVIAQEIKIRHAGKPIGIVDHDRIARTIAKAQEARKHPFNAGFIGGDLFWRQHRTGFVFVGWVADLGGRPAH